MTFAADQAIFHGGELAIQRKLGIEQRMDKFARQMVRSYMPAQHRTFYQQLPYLFAGFQDSSGCVWASILTGKAGDESFIESNDKKSLSINTLPMGGDPLAQALQDSPSLRLGLLGIDLSNRRRNRLSAELVRVAEAKMELAVLQSFGNCPQYIQTRQIIHRRPSDRQGETIRIEHFSSKLRQVIKSADTFFVASSSQSAGTKQQEDASLSPESGADVSHRGGQPGFIRVDDNQCLTIPDYRGNNHFNTLGNIDVNPNVGLLFLDFTNNDVITLTGTAKVLWDSDEHKAFKGAQRLWQFKLDHGFILQNALPFQWQLEEYSPNSLMTDTWLASRQRIESAKLAQQQDWRQVSVENIVADSDMVKSFYLDWGDGLKPKFKAGQFITLQVVVAGKTYLRNYTISSAPNDPFFRISIKKEVSRDGLSPDGRVSSYLHNNLSAGDTLLVKAPQGQFYITPEDPRPAVLLSAGIGITPMLSMFKELVNHGIKTRQHRPVLMINSARNGKAQVFCEEIKQAQALSKGTAKALWLFSKPSQNDSNQQNYDLEGRLNKATLQRILPLDDYQFFICGPGKYMQDIYDTLRQLGVQDSSIEAESFGPASLQRSSKPLSEEQKEASIAEQAIVQFKKSSVEQPWNKQDGNLLAFAEAHGLEPVYGCRTGQCGACAVKVVSGKVEHSDSATALIARNEALLCCAKPAYSEAEQIPTLILET